MKPANIRCQSAKCSGPAELAHWICVPLD